MATSKAYLEFIPEQFAGTDGITYRAMMGEYLLYYRGTLFGGIYDNRLLVKPVPAAAALMPGAALEAPYPGAKAMLAVDAVDDRALLARRLSALHDGPASPK